jgi:UDP-N-acetyl-D-galactosamine dehydrogenase
VVGFDIKASRIAELKAGNDSTREINPEELAEVNIQFTDQADDLKSCDFFIIAVPTPVSAGNEPDLSPLLAASRFVAKALKPGDIVVYESTVYPGATEEDCVPELEKHSGLQFGVDFTVGYSPERINPGDRIHTFVDIKKIVSGSDARTLDIVAEVYGSVVTAGVHRASAIRVAEAAKVIENTQRDLNIALMNEFSVVFKRMGIDTQEVLEAAGSKWNFLPFRPGLVGGHCIGVDPYYLTHKAEKLGYIPQVILAGRRINDNMGRYVARNTIKLMVAQGIDVARSCIGVLGLTFKENCPDTRNSKVVDMIREFEDYGVRVVVSDPYANRDEVFENYGIDLITIDAERPVDALVLAVSHSDYKNLTASDLRAMTRGEHPVLIDVKCIQPRLAMEAAGFTVWRL